MNKEVIINYALFVLFIIILSILFSITLVSSSLFNNFVSKITGNSIAINIEDISHNIDESIWSQYSEYPAIIENNKLKCLGDVIAYSKSGISSENKYTLQGDFDIQVNYDNSMQELPRENGSSAIFRLQGTNYYYALLNGRALFKSNGAHYIVAWTNQLLNVNQWIWGSMESYTESSGKFRLKRTGNTMQGYIWDSRINNWNNFATISDCDTTDMHIILYAQNIGDTKGTFPIAYFDNLIINKEDENICIPNCIEKQCGDNGCNGTCGICNSGEKCIDNQCVYRCLAKTCPELGKNCGNINNNCNIQINCGTCNSGKICSNNICVFPSDPCANKNCDDNNNCTTDSCSNGNCINNPIINCGDACLGKDCNDNDNCTTDSCLNGTCTNSPILNCGNLCLNKNCDDNNSCTTDSCSNGTCTNSPILNCGNLCLNKNCNDNDNCTSDNCIEGICSHIPILDCKDACINKNCNDNNNCTNDTCINGNCINSPILNCNNPCQNKNCNDNNACTIDSCNNGNCINTNIQCETGKICINGNCILPEKCSDCGFLGYGCTIEKCHELGDCYFNPIIWPWIPDCINMGEKCKASPRCSDINQYECNNKPCTLSCELKNNLCIEKINACSFRNCDDEDSCTIDSCLNGDCINKQKYCPNGQACNNGNCIDISIESRKYFQIQVIDSITQRGVPLVELKTGALTYITDSSGRIAFYKPSLMNQNIYFEIFSHGYTYENENKNLGSKILLKTEPNTKTIIKIKRNNIAERLYRITGDGIYRDTVLLSESTQIIKPLNNAQVAGQDSAFAEIYNNKIYWFWGDTARINNAQGHFWVSSATSELKINNGLNPSKGINLNYFVDNEGFSRPIARMNVKRGAIWIDGILKISDGNRERLIAHYSNVLSLSETIEHGLAIFNDEKNEFEKLKIFNINDFQNCPMGHTIVKKDNVIDYFYFGRDTFPVVRVKAEINQIKNQNDYEAFTYLDNNGNVIRDANNKLIYSWKKNFKAIDSAEERKLINQGKITYEEAFFQPIDIDTGKHLIIHGGSIKYNKYRNKYMLISVVVYGDDSFLGDVYYSEAEELTGPWKYAKKIISHKDYTFYNPIYHDFFDAENGRIIYFEGTYSNVFSSSSATPLYDYNQIMYRLNLDDPRLKSVQDRL